MPSPAVRVERIPTLRDNYTYLIIDSETGEAAVVDAPEARPVIARVEKLGVRVVKVLSTHHHPDHSAANPELAAHFKAPVYGHQSDAARLPGFTNGVAEGDTVAIGRLKAQVIFIPAHTRGHVAYVLPGAVFCGDTLFAGGCGRLFEGTPAMMHEALNVKLAKLPDETRVYCGHEYTENNLRFAETLEPENAALRERIQRVRAARSKVASDWHDATEAEMTVPSTLREERDTNPFMRAHSAQLVASVRARMPDAPSDPVGILGAVRALKDKF
jgi:hydroxyacylglutathione hydrolase